MRPQQNNNNNNNRNRSRSRGGSRRNSNPSSRSYESNGPDVKIRGNAQVIADKYTTLARDAQSAGDRVMAENYLQHAEHYNRIILASQPLPRENDDNSDNTDDDDDDNYSNDQNQRDQNIPSNRQQSKPEARTISPDEAPQPVIEGTPAEIQPEKIESTAKPAKKPRARKPRKAAEPKTDTPDDKASTGDTANSEPSSPAISDDTPLAAE